MFPVGPASFVQAKTPYGSRREAFPALGSAMGLVAVLLTLILAACAPKNALRVFIVAPTPNSASGESDVARFAAEWKTLLSQRGVVVKVGSSVPSARQLESTHVLVLYGSAAAAVRGEDHRLRAFGQRGGGLVLLHNAAAAPNMTEISGATLNLSSTNWQAGLISLFLQAYQHPLAEGLSDFEVDDAHARSVQLKPEAQVLASTFNSAGEVTPQAWTIEREAQRVFVMLQGRNAATFQLPHVRGLLLRAMAWAGNRDMDTFVRDDERTHFAYPAGGPTAPEKASARIKVNPEFDLALVASEPMIVNPLALDWDARGRLWVAVAPGLSSAANSSGLKDGVVILEDTNGDARMDQRRVFYEAPRPVTALACCRGGVVIAQPPQILWLADHDGDGTPDQREVLYQGFATGTAFPCLTGFRWGLDAWIYAAHNRPGTNPAAISGDDGRSLGNIGGGLIRFKPDGSAIEQLSTFTNVSVGPDFTWDGEVLFAKAGGSHLSHLVIPEKFLDPRRYPTLTSDRAVADHQKVFPLLTNRPGEPVLATMTNSFRTSAGVAVYDGGAWPLKYQGSYFVCEPGARIVHEDILGTTEGQALEGTRREEEEFLAGTDPWFRPIQARIGPDGAMYLVDFYSLAPFEPGLREPRPDRASAHGRIWRIQHKQARRSDLPVLDKAPTPALVKALEHPNRWVRMTAQRLLTEQGDMEPVDRLTVMLTNRLAPARVHALWTLRHLGALPDTNLGGALTNNPHLLVQRAALRVLEDLHTPLNTNFTKVVMKQFKDSDDRTRLLGILAFAHSMADSNVQQTALKMFPDLKDPYARAVVVVFARQAPMDFLRAAFASDKSENYRELAAALVEDFCRKDQTNEAAQAIQLAALHPTSNEKLNAVVLQTVDKFLSPDFEPAASSELEAAIVKLFVSKSRAVQLANLPLATHWPRNLTLMAEAEKTKDAVLADLKNPKLKDEERIALVTNLFAVKFLRSDLVVELDSILSSNCPPPVQKQIITELARSEEKESGELLVKKYTSFAADLRPALFTAILSHPEWTLALLDAVEQKRISVKDLDLLGINRLRSHPERRIADQAVAVFDALGGAPRQDREAVLAQFKSVLNRPGKLEAGRPLYYQHCEGCHTFPGHPKGPAWSIDLTSTTLAGPGGVLEHILAPNRATSPRWTAWTATTTNGGVFYGMLGRVSSNSIIIRNLEGDHEIKNPAIVSTNTTGISFMPEGYEMLGEEGLRNLLAYVMNKTPKAFHVIPLTRSFTTDSRHSLFGASSDPPEIEFDRFGMVMVESNTIPFQLVNPAATPEGRNLIVLRGGPATNLPAHVEVPVGIEARLLHVLGGIAGFGNPPGQTNQHDASAARMTLHYAGGATEDVVFKDGDQFTDCAKPVDVPGSKSAAHLLVSGHLRWFTVEPKQKEKIEKMVIESLGNHLAPVFVALTAQD